MQLETEKEVDGGWIRALQEIRSIGCQLDTSISSNPQLEGLQFENETDDGGGKDRGNEYSTESGIPTFNESAILWSVRRRFLECG